MRKTSTLLFALTACLAGAELQAQQLFSNGSFTTGATAKNGSVAPTGYTWSEVQNDNGVTTISNANAGFSSLKSSGFELADDFTVPAGRRWNISSVGVYGYQTGFAGTTSPFTAIYIRIWNGPPSNPASQVVYGDLVTNRFSSSTDALSYRIFNSLYPTPAATGTTRRIWRVVATLPTPVSLPAGTYWVSYSTTTSGTTAHFMVPITTAGLRQTTGANAQQAGSTGVWAPIQDEGTPVGPIVNMDMAFDLEGSSVLGTTAAAPEFALRVGPVPASSLATAEFASLKKPATFVLTDIQGRSVWKASSAVGSTWLQVPLEGMAAGTYLLTMTSEQGSSRARLLKQ
ncbi:T9SS type A sorting domain-containing protein [Hymenobacter psychrotolerans]|uniref:Por secretion system C-terminal sorting domain-containing protein n=1 Tax=Hymenobacter psychrotolerans DSM 18569 TaxID=1121959 RepID=A0A1M7DMR6_9BACT|nr:T9SS type A sorting domain-containing protein [Hymenobacter psychrotolerans]SHL80804.1 Por secretion system C-terminal sorting domain-containing protein [Hymenobacter psychrotolerans DSM 18569]